MGHAVGVVHDKSTGRGCHTPCVATRWAVLRDGIRRFALPAIGIANVVAVGWLPIRLTDAPFTHPSTSGAAAAAALTAGIALLASGLLATALRATNALGSLAILASVAWFAPDWIGWPNAAPLVRGTAMIVAPLLAPIILHLVAAASGALRGSTIRALVAAAYVVTIALSLARAAVRDPIRDLDCFEPPRNCSENVFLLWANEDLARQLDLAQIGVAIAISLGLAVMAAWRLLGGTRPARRSHGPLLVFGAVVGVADTTYIVLLAADHLQTAAEPSLGAAFMVQAGAITALAITLGWQVARARSIGVSVARLATDIGAAPAPGGLERALALALGDPDLAVAYRLPTTDSFVDATGMPAPGASARPGRVATPITRDGQKIAVVLHDPGLVDPEDLKRTIGSAARLAVDNERLRAEVLAQVRAIAELRTRIVEREDAARRHVERDLHDGAQQRLLAISYELRLGRAAATREGNDDRAASFERLIGGTEAVLEDLTRARARDLPGGPRGGWSGPRARRSCRSRHPTGRDHRRHGRAVPGGQRERSVRGDRRGRSVRGRPRSHARESGVGAAEWASHSPDRRRRCWRESDL